MQHLATTTAIVESLIDYSNTRDIKITQGEEEWLNAFTSRSSDPRSPLMIAAGAGAGLAAAFNTPITGVLFVVEELLRDVSSLTLGTAILASFIGAVVSRILGGRSLDLSLVLTAHSTTTVSRMKVSAKPWSRRASMLLILKETSPVLSLQVGRAQGKIIWLPPSVTI